MRHNRLLILGVVVVSAMIAVGCSSSGLSTSDGAAGRTGTGGSGGGAGSAATVDAPMDTVVDAAVETAVDTVSQDAGPCVTDYGAGNAVQFAFNGGAIDGWTAGATSHIGFSFPTTSLGASLTEGHSCPGALLLAVDFPRYNINQSGYIEYFYGDTPNGRNWSGYTAIHAWIKVEGADLSELAGVTFAVQSGNYMFFQRTSVAGADLSDWHEVVVDLTVPPANNAGVVITDVQQIILNASLNLFPADGAAPTPSQVMLLVDDIWLEAAPDGAVFRPGP